MNNIIRRIYISVLTGIILLCLCGCEDSVFTMKRLDEPAEEQQEPNDTSAYNNVIPYIHMQNIDRQSEPVPELPDDTLRPAIPYIKGIYVTANHAGAYYLDALIDIVNETELNAMVIDVKMDDGQVTFKGIPLADEMGISSNIIPDINALIARLKENDIYVIARIVTFKDNTALEKRPELYIKNQDGSIWRDNSKLKCGWLNPYNKDAWEYVLEFAKAAAEVGFDEIQFDYIRFDTASSLKDADFGETYGKSRTEIITEFTTYAVEQLKAYGVYISADVYGTIIGSTIDSDIVGQDYVALASVLDFICPMIYPSHYANGSMGIDYPDTKPYETIYAAMELSNKRLSEIPAGQHCALVRPWLQEFTATWVKPHITYGDKERELQIQAVYDAGASEWLLWSPSVKYGSEGIH